MTEKQLPQKPDNAIWNPADNEWELGQKNSQGQYIGEWMWWLAPTNHLCCHTFFDDNGNNMLSFTRYHPNGEVSRTGKYENGKEIEDIWYRCTEETTEFYADYYSPNNSWKAIKRIGKIPVEFDFYDKDGNHLNGKIELPENLIQGTLDETAKEALDRLQNVLNFIESQGKDLNDYLNDNYKPVFKEKVTVSEIQEAEIRLNIKFPKSYVDFVTNHGLFVLGENNENYSALLEPLLLSRLSDELESDWEVDWEDYTEEQKSIMDKIICFSNGDEGLQSTWFYCFDFNTLNPETGEVTIVGYCQDEWEYLMEDEIEICEEKDAFDAHVKWIVNEAIKEIIEE
jgi:SMI1 / KNR4 family (SUKH-1)